MKQYWIKAVRHSLAGVALITATMASVQAETITIGSGTGIVWEGLPFNETLEGPMVSADQFPNMGLLAISNIRSLCLESRVLKNIGGYMALPLNGVRGVGLVPRASGSGTYFTYERNNPATISGTIGLPETKGSSSAQSPIFTPSGLEWCLPVKSAVEGYFYSKKTPRVMTLSGTWVLVADGTQRAGEATVPPMYFVSLSSTNFGDLNVSILPTNISLRISTLECTVNTPTAIDFGPVNRNTQANTELAVKPVPLVTNCGQPSDHINANINLQFRQLSGLYDGEVSRLALSQGGGYITGEIDNGVTGSGACTGTTGVRFDGSPVKQGSITMAESSTTLTNLLTWRLCSGGSSLPSGPVTASTEMLVTFN